MVVYIGVGFCVAVQQRRAVRETTKMIVKAGKKSFKVYVK